MKSHNIALKRLKIVIEILILMFVCLCTTSYATDVNLSSEENKVVTEENTENLPYIEMKVKSKSVDGTTQVLVEAWGSKFSNLEGLEIVFTYDNTKLTPSNIADNSEIINLESIKYEKTPTQSTAQDAFYKASKDVLSNSFAFKNEYADKLGIDLFRYLAPYENNEAMQFVISCKDKINISDISATDPVLLGTFSFKQTKNTTLDETEFTTKRIKIYCDDGLTDEYYSFYTREETNGEDCTEIVEFIYAKYGSISGTIETGYMKPDADGNPVYTLCGSKRVASKKTATIYLYKAEDVSGIKWGATARTYIASRKKIINFIAGEYSNYCIPDENAETEIKYWTKIKTEDGDNGIFKIENIEFGEYVVFIDKYNYGDYIITNITIDSENQDIDLGTISLIAGDMNKDGVFSTTGDRNPFTLQIQLNNKVNEGQQDLSELGISFAYDLNDDGKAVLAGDRNIFIYAMKCIDKQTIKQVVDFKEMNMI